ncbi:Ivy family c-type lysozyme inhibitor [Rhodoferax saidenbachensis]|uniref:Lysozyme inhibitor n=1 Tax=Rhodoferax saidenbachensis TaxID=1484693 RepID=A0ABU1ZNC5_9BURK|nr:Ivy family c-type lysozyme inhibitor [Rhodoferax saidenbachensis]MDR7307042.1 hypothetical protein [Rhodoferax saidenbachensis]
MAKSASLGHWCLVWALLAWGSTGTAAEPYPWELLKDRDFSKAYTAMLGPHIRQPWLAQLNGPANPVEHIQLGPERKDLIRFEACRPHQCDTDYITVLYFRKHRRAYARLVLPSGVFMLGRPPGTLAELLAKP